MQKDGHIVTNLCVTDAEEERELECLPIKPG